MELDRHAVLQSFAAESEEGLAAMESALLELEANPEQHELVAGMFRVVHTLKGNALLLGFESLSDFAHEIENVLARVRARELKVTQEVISCLLSGTDALRAAVTASLAGSGDVLATYSSLRKQLKLLEGCEADSANQLPHSSELGDLPSASSHGAKTLRVSTEKLDRLLNLVGEISIAHGRVQQMIAENLHGDVASVLDAHADVDRLFLELQGTILQTRMVPVGPLFRQCARAVRDLAPKLGKQAEVVISGEEVDVDTSVTELIRDPLVHMVRNALDHGIETPDERRAVGKHPRGSIQLSAEHKGGTIVIELRDDGRGIDWEAVRDRARVEGLIGQEDTPSEKELYRLLFRAGFSTSRQVSDMSGRGVGLDVVRRNIEALRGSVQISSERGVGTSIRIRLPLTLAILEGFLVGVGDETYVVALESAVECLDFPPQHISGRNGSAVIEFRGRPLPVLRLRSVFDVSNGRKHREKVLVVRDHDVLAGLIVDEFYGQRQVVIKSMAQLAPVAYGISGSTILGDGRVALLLDVPRLMNDAVELTRAEA